MSYFTASGWTKLLGQDKTCISLALRAPTTVLADCTPTALLAFMALTTVRTSAAHLAVRAVLHPVLARPVVLRGYLPLRALLGQLLSRCIRVLCIADIRNVYPDSRPPNRRHHPPRGRRAHRSEEVMILTTTTVKRQHLASQSHVTFLGVRPSAYSKFS